MTSHLMKALYLGKPLTPEEQSEIPHYRAELHFHVFNKCVQAGSILGMVVLGPLIGGVRGRSFSAVKNGAIKGGKIGVMVMTPLAPLMTEGAIRNATEEAVYDRSFRLRANEGQLRADRWGTLGGLVGAGSGTLLGVGLATGLIAGVAVGTLSAGVYTSQQPKK